MISSLYYGEMAKTFEEAVRRLDLTGENILVKHINKKSVLEVMM